MIGIKFTLRAALVAILVSAITLTWYVRWMQDGARARLFLDRNRIRVVQRDYCGPQLLSPLLSKIPAFQRATQVSIKGDSIVDGRKLFREIPFVEILNIDADVVTDGDMKHIRRCHRLRSLLIEGSGITNASLPEIANCRSLQELALFSMELNQRDFELLASISSLESLYLSDCCFNENDLHILLMNEKLGFLDLQWTCVSDEIIQQLRKARPALTLVY